MEKIGRYELKGEIGRGGMATVYRGFDPRFGREVAVKVLPPALLHDPQFRARFEREAHTIATLEHPAIVPVHDYGEDDGRLYLIMRLMTGGSLDDKLLHGPIPLEEAARIFGRLASALDSAHSRAIVHRDLKPANILFDQWNEPYLSDFGIVKLMEGDSPTLTGTGGIIGTPAYMSPEQIMGGQDLDGRSDIYALGVILYETLTGQRPYKGDTPMRLAFKHVNEPIPKILDASPSLSPGCQGIIEKAMAKDRDKRYGTAAALAADLAQLAQPELTFNQQNQPVPKAPEQTKTTVSSISSTAETQIETPPELKPPAPFVQAEEQPVPSKRPTTKIALVGVAVLVCLLLIAAGVFFGPKIAASLQDEAAATVRPEPTERPTITVESPFEPTTIPELEEPGFNPPLACLDPLGCVEVGPDEPIQLAALQLLSGPSTFLGEDQLRAVELALEAWGDIEGHPLEVLAIDDGCSEERGQAAAEEIVNNNKIVGVIGTSCTNAAIGAMPLLSEAGLSMISGSNTSANLTAVDGIPAEYYHPGYFRVSTNDLIQSRSTARFIFQELGLRRAATLSTDGVYSQQVVDIFNNEFILLGGEVVLSTNVSADEESIRSTLSVAALNQAEIIFFPLFEDAGSIVVNEARNISGLENTVLLGGDGLLSASFVESVGRNGIGMYFVGPAAPSGPAYDEMVVRYQERYGESPISPFHPFAYDATNILLRAIIEVVQVDEDGTLLVGRQRLREAIQQTTGYEGLTGFLSCDQFGDCGSWWLDYYRLEDPAASLEGLLKNVVFRYREERS